MTAIDRTSFDILRQLTKDARISNKELASAVGLAPSSCHERLKHLRSTGVLRGAHADVDLQSLGIGMEAVIQVELRRHGRAAVEAFIRRVRSAVEVRQILVVTGRFDVFVQVAIRDINHLREVADARFTSDKDVERIETCVIFQSWSDKGRLPIANVP